MKIRPVTQTHAALGESPVWDAETQRLWWVDIPAGLVHRHDPNRGQDESFELGENVGFVAPIDDARAYVGGVAGVYLVDFATQTAELFAKPDVFPETNRFNEACVDPRGRLWMGDMGMGTSDARGRFHRLDPDGRVTTWFDAVFITNGLAFSPSGDRMYFADSHPSVRKIWVCDYDIETGTPSAPRLFVDTAGMAGRPDGAAIDTKGCYWIAGTEGWRLFQFSPGGKLLQTVDVPLERPTKLAFGGPDLDLIYVTSFGAGLIEGSQARQPDAGRVLEISGLGYVGVIPPRALAPLGAGLRDART
jgi:sugar lactone lactonase YvrE